MEDEWKAEIGQIGVKKNWRLDPYHISQECIKDKWSFKDLDILHCKAYLPEVKVKL